MSQFLYVVLFLSLDQCFNYSLFLSFKYYIYYLNVPQDFLRYYTTVTFVVVVDNSRLCANHGHNGSCYFITCNYLLNKTYRNAR